MTCTAAKCNVVTHSKTDLVYVGLSHALGAYGSSMSIMAHRKGVCVCQDRRGGVCMKTLVTMLTPAWTVTFGQVIGLALSLAQC